MNGNHVFDIPIYRLSPEERLKEIESIKAVYTNPSIFLRIME